MRITFVLNMGGTLPCGGLKVVYEYANHLTRKGHSVTVIHPARVSADMPWMRRAKKTIRYIQRKIDSTYRPDQWFKVDKKVRLRWVPSLAEQYIPDGDVIVATWWETAEWVNSYARIKGRPFYLIQHWETWCGREARVSATWKMPLRKIVISRWLKDIADGMNEVSLVIPNGLDFQQFGMDTPPQVRNGNECMMLYHTQDWKGSGDGLGALSIVKRQIPELRVTLFGVSNAPQNLPAWINYHRRPLQTGLRKLYNDAAIFISPSWSEGWPLPPAEAMMCGAALVATDIGGHREYARHQQTALLSPPKSPDLLAANIVRLMRDSELRIALAKQGNEYIQQFTWEKATERVEAAFMQSGT